MGLYKLTAVTIIILFIIMAGCASRVEYIKIPPSKVYAVPPLPNMDIDQLQPQFLKPGQEFKAQSGGGVYFNRLGYEGLKIHLRNIKIWMETIRDAIDQYNRDVDKINAEKKK